MSLLMQALKKAERAKQSHAHDEELAKPSEAFDQMLALAPQPPTPHQEFTLELAALAPEPAADEGSTSAVDAAAQVPEAEPVRPAGAAAAEAAANSSRGARNVPPPPQPPRPLVKRPTLSMPEPRTIRLLALAGIVLLVAAVFGYIYWRAVYGPGSSRNLPMVPMPGQDIVATNPAPGAEPAYPAGAGYPPATAMSTYPPAAPPAAAAANAPPGGYPPAAGAAANAPSGGYPPAAGAAANAPSGGYPPAAGATANAPLSGYPLAAGATGASNPYPAAGSPSGAAAVAQAPPTVQTLPVQTLPAQAAVAQPTVPSVAAPSGASAGAARGKTPAARAAAPIPNAEEETRRIRQENNDRAEHMERLLDVGDPNRRRGPPPPPYVPPAEYLAATARATPSSSAAAAAPAAAPAASLAGTSPAAAPATYPAASAPSSYAGAPDSAGIRVARSSTPAHVNPVLQQGYNAFKAGDFASARKHYQSVLQQDANNRDALLGSAALALHEHQPEQAAALYARLLDLNPNDGDALAGLAGLRSGDPSQAEGQLRRALAQTPESPALLFALGNLYARQGRWQEAQQHYFKAYTNAPENADYAFNLAVGLDRLGQPRLALGYYQRALALNPGGAVNFDRNAAAGRIRALGGQ